MEYVVYPLMSHLHQREQLASGYPLLSPTNVTLIQTVVNILYQLQSKEPWSKAIAQVCIMVLLLRCICIIMIKSP